MAGRVKRRTYSSPIREARARRTKQEIAAAANRLFRQHGYAGTTIEGIADAAGVAVQTVYAVFGNKRSILWSLLETSVAGDPEPRTVLERASDELEGCHDPHERLRRICAFGRRVMERSIHVHNIMREAAASDPEIRAALEEVEARRYQDAKGFVELVVGAEDLRDGLGAREATDFFFALTGYGPYEDLVVRRRWSANRYERWITAALAAVLHV